MNKIPLENTSPILVPYGKRINFLLDQYEKIKNTKTDGPISYVYSDDNVLISAYGSSGSKNDDYDQLKNQAINQLRGESKALQLTFLQPYGSVPTGSGTPIWVSWGTAGGLIPSSSLFIDPVGYVLSNGTRYVWAKIGISDDVILLADSLDFVTATSSNAYVTSPFSGSVPPDYMYVPLGSIVATESGSLININNNGAGSIVPSIHISDVTVDELGRPSIYKRNLTYHRVQT